MPDIRFGQGSNEVVRVSDGLNELVEKAMEVAGYSSKAQLTRDALAFYIGYIIANKDVYKCEKCGTRLSTWITPPRFVYQCDCD